jgi:hypothetical protein
MKKEIKWANACYTGGGIYVYTGELDDGTFFCTDDVSEEDDPMLFDCDPTDEDITEEFITKHNIGFGSDFQDPLTRKKVLEWIILNKPSGNYLVSELEERLREEI